jgi:hypothetical protein
MITNETGLEGNGWKVEQRGSIDQKWISQSNATSTSLLSIVTTGDLHKRFYGSANPVFRPGYSSARSTAVACIFFPSASLTVGMMP